MNNDKDFKYNIHYFFREMYYQTAECLALDAIKIYLDDPSFKLYIGFALVLSGRLQEGIRELEPLLNIKNVNIGAVLALIAAHKSSQITDKDAIFQLETKLKVDLKVADDLGLYFGALFLYFNKKFMKSIEYIEKYLKNNPDSFEGLTLKGWIEISLNQTKNFKAAVQCFNNALEKEIKNLDASLGLVKVKENENDVNGAMTLLNQLIVKYPNFLPPLIEKMKLQLMTKDWDLTLEIADRILNTENCIEAFRIKAIIFICRDGNFEEAAHTLKKIFIETEKIEAKNGRLFLKNAQLFSYLSGKNPKILLETYLFAEKAAQLEPSNPDFLTELGYQNLLQGKTKEALKFFKNTTKLDESSVSALTGLILCQIQEGEINQQIKQQVEFLREIQKDQLNSELLLMSAKLADSPLEALTFLNQATEIHFNNLKQYHYGITYLYHLNPVLLMDLINEYLKYASLTNTDSLMNEEIPDLYSKSILILEELIESCPGSVEAQYKYAYIQFLVGNYKKSKQVLNHILDDLDSTIVQVYILMAQIHLQEKAYRQGVRILEVGLSYNFKIREHPIYHIVTALVEKEKGNLSDCINLLKSAMSAINSKSKKNKTDLIEFDYSVTVNDKMTLYLELIEAYQQNNQIHEASKLMDEAIEEFSGTSEAGRLTIANAQILAQQGKVNQGIQLLQKIHPGEHYYTLAKKTQGNIYLTFKKDRDMFAECYKDLVTNIPNAETFTMLGDAFMSIQEPDQAIEAYEKALKTNSRDVNLICKLGKALVKTHYFSKAINHFKEAVKTGENLELTYNLAALYFKLNQLDNAERVIVTELENEKTDSTEINQLIMKTKLLQLLAKVRDKSGNLTESLSALRAAKENYSNIDKKYLSQSDEHKETISFICSDMAILLTRLRDFNAAIKCYKEALSVKLGDPKILVALSRLYMQVNDFEECQATNKKLLAADPNSEPAIIMLADLAFRKVDFETAAFHLQHLLKKKPTCWSVLAKLIEVMRRIGNLEDVCPLLEKAESEISQPHQNAGFSFCKGLYERYAERPSAALQHFNRARRHSEWGQKAVYNMIEICLNPENETLRSEAFTEEIDKEEIQNSRENVLKTAQRLLLELKNQGSDDTFNHRILGNFWLLATNQNANIDKALQDFVIIAGQDVYKDSVAVALGIATSYVLQKQIQKARNHLKRVLKNQWNYEEAEYFERAWLLLTDIYIQSGKTDAPVELIQKVLKHNKSCYKAYDYAGLIAEKEQLYKDSILQYENSWRYCNQTNPGIGYKLAFNYLKVKKYAEAIEVCYAILKMYPNYPRLQKEILEKAKMSLRI